MVTILGEYEECVNAFAEAITVSSLLVHIKLANCFVVIASMTNVEH